MLYTNEVQKAVREIKSPYPTLKVSVVEYPGMLSLRVYESNITEFSPMQHITIMEYLHTLKRMIESFGIKCDLEGAEGI